MKLPQQVLLTLFIFCSLFSGAQIRLPLAGSFRSDVQKIVEDFPGGFRKYKGSIINQDPQTVQYASGLIPNGTHAASITQYSSSGKPVYSFETTLMETESFGEAAQKYRWTFHQLKGLNIKYIEDRYTLGGSYIAPLESKGFSSSILTPIDPAPALSKIRVEVFMRLEFPNWKVGLLLYEKEWGDTEGMGVDQ